MWGKCYFCSLYANSKSYISMNLHNHIWSWFHRVWDDFHGYAWCTVSCDAVWFIITHSLPIISLFSLLNRGNTVPFSLLLLIVPFPWLECVLVSVVCISRYLFSSSGTTCINIFPNCLAAFLPCSCRYCSVIIRVLHMCFIPHIFSLPVFTIWMMYDHPLWLLP